MFEPFHCFGRPRGLPKGVKIGPPRPLGGVLEPLEVSEASWNILGFLLESLGCLLGALGAVRGRTKTNLDRLLAGPRAPRRPVSNGLGAKSTSKRGSQKVPKLVLKPNRAENVKTAKNVDLPQDVLGF